MGTNKEEEFVEEWVQDSQNGSQVPLDHLVSLYGYALLGLEDGENQETVRFRKIEEPEQHYSENLVEEEKVEIVEEEEYEEPKRRMKVSFC
ncbi:hypothetical protein GCK72_007819 [Caenorhabditis remanei]|uniref:Uncharacterized protein n=1 Tax=Caenorhabditis remanei TaxID=31234 RepID=A0A6A5HI84_CAERE|nr:hypothetical protein GCK72_007819 [Caenorhabditis remanei]KAF1767860.1 hypothetical protein GCK72_007819 [Caenorhabditis remanei]